jgi:ElaB/YqjD/DUF883 family membrane-anchored ribosome-binding protein
MNGQNDDRRDRDLHEVLDDMEARAKVKVEETRAKAEEGIERMRKRISDSTEKVEKYVKENPEKATAIAAGVGAFFGAVLAALMGRRRR